MENKELLTYTAKAANYTLKKWCCIDGNEFFIAHLPLEGHENEYPEYWSEEYWNPIEDSGDALRLAVKLGLDIAIDQKSSWVSVYYTDKQNSIHSYSTPYSENVNADVRKAIVTLAAMIGQIIVDT